MLAVPPLGKEELMTARASKLHHTLRRDGKDKHPGDRDWIEEVIWADPD
jgi:hypothetical protein